MYAYDGTFKVLRSNQFGFEVIWPLLTLLGNL